MGLLLGCATTNGSRLADKGTYWGCIPGPLEITSRFGDFEEFRTSPHEGIDVEGGCGAVIAAADGKVVRIFVDKNADYCGIGVILEHDVAPHIPRYGLYCHFASLVVARGQFVLQGQFLGRMGDTGKTTGVHSHIEFTRNSPSSPAFGGQEKIDPETVIVGCYKKGATPDSGQYTWPVPCSSAPKPQYKRDVTLSVGQSTVIHGARGECGEAPPDWEEVVRGLPLSLTGSYSDGGLGVRWSRSCGGPTPARAVKFTAEKAGSEQIVLYGDPINITVK